MQIFFFFCHRVQSFNVNICLFFFVSAISNGWKKKNIALLLLSRTCIDIFIFCIVLFLLSIVVLIVLRDSKNILVVKHGFDANCLPLIKLRDCIDNSASTHDYVNTCKYDINIYIIYIYIINIFISKIVKTMCIPFVPGLCTKMTRCMQICSLP